MQSDLRSLVREAMQIARRYRELTGKPLGITGEIGELEAARLLRLELAPARTPGYDATRRLGRRIERLQIKTRVVPSQAKPGQHVGSISLQHKWDAVILVLLDEDFLVQGIYRATRAAIEKALLAPGSIARNKGGALSVSKFKAISTRLWPA